MILILEFYGVKFLESKYETFHHLKKNVRNVSKFKKNQHSKNTYWNTLLRETTFSGSSELLRKTKFEVSSRWSDFEKTYTNCQILNETFGNVSQFEESLHEKSVVMNHATPKKRHFLYFPCFSKSMILKVFKASES